MLLVPSDRMVGFFSVTSTLDGERKGESPERASVTVNIITTSCCTPTLAQRYNLICASTWTAVQFQSRLDGGDRGDDGSVWHDGSVHVHFLGGGVEGTKWQSIAGLLCFHIQQLEE